MLAQDIFDTAPLGATIRFFIGDPKPPARFTKKLKAWENDNGTGRLTVKAGASRMGNYVSTPSFALHLATYSSAGTPILIVTRHYSVNCALEFEILDVPQPGMVRVLTEWNGTVELRHLASDMDAARRWAEQNRYSDMRFDAVSADEANYLTQTRRAA